MILPILYVLPPLLLKFPLLFLGACSSGRMMYSLYFADWKILELGERQSRPAFEVTPQAS